MEILFVSRFLESRANNNNLNGDFDFELKKKKESKHDNDEREAFLLFGNESFIIYININIKKKLLEWLDESWLNRKKSNKVNNRFCSKKAKNKSCNLIKKWKCFVYII